MTSRYLLDKSAAYRTHVPEVRARLEPLMQRGLLARCGLTDLEFGVSARSAEDHRSMGIWRRDALEYLATVDGVWERAWEVQERLSANGLHRSVKVPDLIIAAVAEHHAVSVMHYDQDFDRIAAITGQPAEWVVPRGSV
jgi:predicted nucleic acid-binding protein